MNREEILTSIQDEFDYLSDHEKLNVINDYMGKNYRPLFYRNSEEKLTALCEDSLTTYFEQLAHSSHYDKTDEFFTLDGNGWIRSLQDIDAVADEINLDELAEFVYENFSDYDSVFEETSDAMEESEEEEEEE